MKCADILQILYDTLRQRLLEKPVIYADESTLKVVSDNKSKSYIRLYTSCADSPEGNLADTDIPKIVLYGYKVSRAGPIDYLGGYNGYMRVDGYAGYHKSGKIEWALNHIQKLYRVVVLMKGETADESYRIRQEKSLPLLTKFKT